MKINYKIRKFKCLGCGKEVELRRAKDNLKYCSLDCYRKSARPQRKTGKEVKCAIYCAIGKARMDAVKLPQSRLIPFSI